MSRPAWVALWWAATLLATVAAMRALVDILLLSMGQDRPVWMPAVAVAFSLAWAALAIHANRRRRELAYAEMMPPEAEGRGP